MSVAIDLTADVGADAIGKQRTVTGLQHVTDSLSGLLKSGLSRFGLQFEAPPQPSEHPLVIVFVVGGISMREIRDIQVRSLRSPPAGIDEAEAWLGQHCLSCAQHRISASRGFTSCQLCVTQLDVLRRSGTPRTPSDRATKTLIAARRWPATPGKRPACAPR